MTHPRWIEPQQYLMTYILGISFGYQFCVILLSHFTVWFCPHNCMATWAPILPDNHGLLIRLLCNSSEITKTEIYNIVRIARKEILNANFTGIRKT